MVSHIPVEPALNSLEITRVGKREQEMWKTLIARLADAFDQPVPSEEGSLPTEKFVSTPLTIDQLVLIESREGIQQRVIQEIGTFYNRASQLTQRESHEPLVDLKRNPQHLVCNPTPTVVIFANEEKQFERQFLVREQVAEGIWQMAKKLSALGYTLYVYDALRSPAQQEALYARRVGMMIDVAKRSGGQVNLNELLTIAQTQTAATPLVAGHLSGAAADFGLMYKGELVNMGYTYPLVPLTGLPQPLSSDGTYLVPFETFCHREILSLAMRWTGLQQFIGEHWHASAHDVSAICSAQSLGQLTSTTIEYLPISKFDSASGQVTPFEVDLINQPFYMLNPSLMETFKDIAGQ